MIFKCIIKYTTMNITNSFLFNVINDHHKFSLIEKQIIANSITCKNYINFDVYNVNAFKEIIEIAEKYKLNYKMNNFASKGGGTHYTVSLIFPDYQSDINDIQNFYFLNKKRYLCNESNKMYTDNTLKHSEILKKFTLIENNYEANIHNLNLKDLKYIDEYIVKLTKVTKDNKIIIDKSYLYNENVPTIVCKEFGENIYQKCIDFVASKLYLEIMLNGDAECIKYNAYYFKNLDENKFIEIINTMLENRYIFSKEQNFDCSDIYESEEIYVLKKNKVIN